MFAKLRLIIAAFAVSAMLGTPSPSPAADAIALHATPVPLDPVDPGRDQLGRLVYRGGLVLESPDSRFGGWSDLRLNAEGTKLVAISDRGFWLDAELLYDGQGRLHSLAGVRLGPLIDVQGRPLHGVSGDAEGLAAGPDGSFYVSFERQHRIWLYPAAEPPFSRPPRNVATPARLRQAPANGGLEALLRLSDGELLMLVEELLDGGEHVGWLGQPGQWQELHYRAASKFKPTALAELPPATGHGGDVLVLERRLTFPAGLEGRIVRLDRRAIAAGAHLAGEELARLQSPLTVDNFEGIAAAADSNGAARIYIISDDNYSFLQRTLLLMFEYK